jgi:hypothetical protein
MSRRKVTLRLNSDVVERAKNAGMNLSYFLEVKLVEYLALLNVTPRRRFELVFTSKNIKKEGRFLVVYSLSSCRNSGNRCGCCSRKLRNGVLIYGLFFGTLTSSVPQSLSA